MRITRIGAQNFLSFRDLDFADVGPGLTVVVGPNGAGKSNLIRVIELMGRALAFADFTRSVDFGRYLDARHVGASAGSPLTIRVGVALDEPAERALIRHFVQAFVASLALGSGGQAGVLSRAAVEKWVTTEVTDEKINPLFRGELVASWGGVRGAEEWSIGYEFDVEATRLSWSFRGRLSDTVGAGLIEAGDQVTSYGSLWERLQQRSESMSALDAAGAFDLGLLLPDDRHSRVGGRPDALSSQQAVTPLAALADGLGVPFPQGNSIPLAAVMHHIFRTGVVLVPGQRPSPQRYFSGAMTALAREPEDLGALPVELQALQSGTRPERERYERIRERFRELTGREFSMQAQPSRRQPPVYEDEREIEPRISEGSSDVPLGFAGAGLWEALVLSHATTASESAVVVLDEPAQNLHPTLQQRVLGDLLNRPGQTLLVTHSPYLIPTRNRDDLVRVARIERVEAESRLRRLAPATPGDRAEREQEGQLWQLMVGSTDARGLLFASAVVLCEGGTEVGVLEQWLNTGADRDTPGGKNIVFFDVGGDQRFGFYARYLDSFGIPWAIVCDSKVMNPYKKSSIHEQLGIGRPRRSSAASQQADPTFTKAAFARQRKQLESAGVFTLVKEPDSEIETFLKSLDLTAWQRAGRSEAQNKIRRGRVFAANVDCPAEVTTLWEKLSRHLRLGQATVGR
jgi:hypothetical protein